MVKNFSLSINVAARVFIPKRLISLYCPCAELGQYWSKEDCRDHMGGGLSHGRIGKGRFLMRDLMAYQDDEIIKVPLSLNLSSLP